VGVGGEPEVSGTPKAGGTSIKKARVRGRVLRPGATPGGSQKVENGACPGLGGEKKVQGKKGQGGRGKNKEKVGKSNCRWAGPKWGGLKGARRDGWFLGLSLFNKTFAPGGNGGTASIPKNKKREGARFFSLKKRDCGRWERCKREKYKNGSSGGGGTPKPCGRGGDQKGLFFHERGGERGGGGGGERGGKVGGGGAGTLLGGGARGSGGTPTLQQPPSRPQRGPNRKCFAGKSKVKGRQGATGGGIIFGGMLLVLGGGVGTGEVGSPHSRGRKVLPFAGIKVELNAKEYTITRRPKTL